MPSRGLRRDTRRGQAMVEFSLVIPVLFFVLFGAFEFGLMMFSTGSARYASADGARVVSEQGTLIKACKDVPGCSKLASPGSPTADCNADCQALSAVILGPLGTTSIATVKEIDVAKLQINSDGSLTCSGSSTKTPNDPPFGCTDSTTNTFNSFWFNSTQGYGNAKGPQSYPPSGRNVTLGQADYVAVTVQFKYVWKTALFNSLPVPDLHATYNIRLEPQRFPLP